MQEHTIQELLSEIVRKQHSMKNKYYQDEPILRTGAQMLMETPPRIRQMRRISGYGKDGALSMEARFLRQGQMMADFTDHFPEYVPCIRTVPMYYNLRDLELRCFFTWRTRRRAGETPETGTAYLLLYCFELLNQIGVSTPEEGDACLRKLLQDYGAEHPELRKLLPGWIADYDALYRLPYSCMDEQEQAITTILRHMESSAADFLQALNRFSKYHILQSKLYKAKPQETALAVQAAYRALLRYYAEQKHCSFPATLFGERKREEHILFEGAVYCSQHTPEEGAYRLSPNFVYYYYHGCWAREIFCGEPNTARIGALLHTMDSVLRELLHFPYALKAEDLPEGDREVIVQAISAELAEQKRKKAPPVTLDRTRLEKIRQAAEHTTDMLTLPEEEASLPREASLPQEDCPPTPRQEAKADKAQLPGISLSAPAQTLLRSLLKGDSLQPLQDAGYLLTVLTEEINEALYEQFGDTVLETDENDCPYILEDYQEELKGLFLK